MINTPAKQEFQESEKKRSTPSFGGAKPIKRSYKEIEAQPDCKKYKFDEAKNKENQKPDLNKPTEYISMAELVKNVLIGRDHQPSAHDPTHLTVVQPFNFALDTIYREPKDTKTTDQVEYEKFIEMPKFKPLPLNSSILTKSPPPLKKSVSMTTFKEFNLSRSVPKPLYNENENKPFRATPVNHKMLEKPDFTYKKSPCANTLVKPFCFHTEARKGRKSISADYLKDCSEYSFKAKPMPDMTKKFIPQHPMPTKIEFHEFDLATQKRSAAKSKVQIQPEEQPNTQFKPIVIPDFKNAWEKTDKIKEQYVKPQVTIPQEFKLLTGERGMQKARDFEEIKERIASEYSNQFKAQQVARYKEFTIQKSEAKPTIPDAPLLHTAERAVQREQSFSKLEQRRKEEKEKKKVDEEWELRQLRKLSSFKAMPVPTDTFAPIIPHGKEPTVGISPNLETEKRCQK